MPNKIFAFLAGLLFCAASLDAGTVRLNSPSGQIEVMEGVVLVKYRSSASAEERSRAGAGISKSRGDALAGGWVPVYLESGVGVDGALAAFKANPAVESALPDRVYRAVSVPNDPLFPSQYGLGSIAAPAAWEMETGFSSPTIIAVMDTGIDSTHEDLATRISTWSASFTPVTGAYAAEPQPYDCIGHGTHVAGTAAANTNNGVGVAGVAWGAQLLSLRVFSPSVYSCTVTDDVAISSAMAYAVSVATTTGRRLVINMSLGAVPSSLTDTCPQEADAIALARSHGIPLVAAAGNYTTPDSVVGKAVNCPARADGVWAVAAVDSSGNVADFSAQGPQLLVAAPGVSVLGPKRGGGYYTLSGTSMASPHVAGLAALLLSAKPALSETQARQYVQAGAGGTFSQALGYGQINAYRTLRAAVGSSSAEDAKWYAFPSPFRPSKHKMLTFSLPRGISAAELEIKIYNSTGDLVRRMNCLTWDGNNSAGNPVASGVYAFHVKTANGEGTGRFAIIQ